MLAFNDATYGLLGERSNDIRYFHISEDGDSLNVFDYDAGIAPFLSRMKSKTIGGERIKISVLDRGSRGGGQYRLHWRAESLSSGVYFVKLKSGGREDMRKVNLVR